MYSRWHPLPDRTYASHTAVPICAWVGAWVVGVLGRCAGERLAPPPRPAHAHRVDTVVLAFIPPNQPFTRATYLPTRCHQQHPNKRRAQERVHHCHRMRGRPARWVREECPGGCPKRDVQEKSGAAGPIARPRERRRARSPPVAHQPEGLQPTAAHAHKPE